MMTIDSPVSDTDINTFVAVDIRAGTIREAKPFPKARKPAYQLTIDFGPLGVRRSSAQITVHYTPEDLVGRQVMAVINIGSRRIAGFVSECLVLGVPDEADAIVLLEPERPVPDGVRMF